jgi:hypothetical protein
MAYEQLSRRVTAAANHNRTRASSNTVQTIRNSPTTSTEIDYLHHGLLGVPTTRYPGSGHIQHQNCERATSTVTSGERHAALPKKQPKYILIICASTAHVSKVD